ncbi:MAG: pyridoxal-phosphate dependent enzyme [Bergeyella sp.]
MLKISELNIPITELYAKNGCRLFIKREDLIHPQVSGNKYWKLFYNLNHYLENQPENPFIITFGGAFSNHISAVSYVAKMSAAKSLGIIRGEELSENWNDNPTLQFAHENGMDFLFVSREEYRDKESLKEKLKQEFPYALIVEEGGTNELAVRGIGHMLGTETKDFHYLCTAVGTGGTTAGLSKHCDDNQNVIGFKTVGDSSLEEKILNLSGRKNFTLKEPLDRYGKISDETVRFINDFYEQYEIPLDPVYTGKMMLQLFRMIDSGGFPDGSKILAFHTGGLQGIEGANQLLKKQNRKLIEIAL